VTEKSQEKPQDCTCPGCFISFSRVLVLSLLPELLYRSGHKWRSLIPQKISQLLETPNYRMSVMGRSLSRFCLVVPIHERPRIFLATLHNHSLLYSYSLPNYSLNTRSGLFGWTVRMPSCTLHIANIITWLQYCVRVYLWTRKTDPCVVYSSTCGGNTILRSDVLVSTRYSNLFFK
jgi:hypothetical protein